MGVGNYAINNGKTVQIDHSQLYGDFTEDGFELIQHEFDYQLYFNEFLTDINGLIPDAYEAVDEYNHRESSRIIAENNFYTIEVKDWEGYVAISLVLKDEDERYEAGIHPLAEYHLESRVSDNIGRKTALGSL